MPARPFRPTDKGKVENAVKYVKNNALRGRRFKSLAEINTHLRQCESTVADQRIHGTTRQQVEQHFLEVEKAALRPLPESLFECFEEGRRKVHPNRTLLSCYKTTRSSVPWTATKATFPPNTCFNCL